jgi:predicted Zn finger-like uncharacterized protein
MIVTCEGCETGFHVEERLLKSGGSKVRCSKCRHVFVAYPPAPAEDSDEPLVLSEEMPPAQRGPVAAGGGSTDATLDGLFDDTAVPEMLDVDDLIMDAPPPAAGAKPEPGDGDLNFDLDLDLGPAGPTMDASMEPDPSAARKPAPAEEEFNFGLEPPAPPMDAAADLPELEEFELDLAALDAAADAPQPSIEKEPVGAGGPELELDLDFDATLEKEGEGEGGSSAAVATSGPSPDLLNELNLDLDSVPDATTTTFAKDAEKKGLLAETDEIDLSDLEKMLDGSALPAAGVPAGEEHLLDAQAGEEPADMSEELDLSFLAETEERPPTLEPAAPEPGPAAPAEPKELATTDELDFSDLSSILENERPLPEAVREIEDVELVLDQAPSASAAGAEQPEGMLDIEAFLTGDPDDASTFDQEGGGPDLAEEAPPKAVTDLEIEFEPSAVADTAGRATRATTAVAGAMPATGTDEAPTEATGVEAGMTGATDVMEAESEEMPAAFKTPQPTAPRRSGGVLRALVGIVLVLVLALAALVLPRSLGLQIPYLTDTEIPILSELDLDLPFIGNVGKLFKVEVPDPAGRLKILPDAGSVTAAFVENPVAGRVLVVRGKVRNGYDHPRSAIRVSATLLAKGGTPIRTAIVYAGNMLSDQELSALDMNAIRSRLQFSTGTANSNVGVKPGSSLPFMAVFDNLPANIDEYSVEVADSKK